jgi:hypothetical protein
MPTRARRRNAIVCTTGGSISVWTPHPYLPLDPYYNPEKKISTIKIIVIFFFIYNFIGGFVFGTL